MHIFSFKKPTHLASQLVGVVIGATIAAAILLTLAFSVGVRQFENRLLQEFVIERLTNIFSLIEQGEPWDNNFFKMPRRRGVMNVSFDTKSSISPSDMTSEDWSLASIISNELGLLDKEVRFQIELGVDMKKRWKGHYSYQGMMHGKRRSQLSKEDIFKRDVITISIEYKKDQWVNILMTRPFRSLKGTKPSFFLISTLGFGGLLIVLGILLTVKTITKPMRSLAEAAEKVGVGEQVPPIAETGPIEIREAISAFNSMHSRLNAFIEDRTSMLAAISHDLRTPLTGLQLRAEMLDESEEKESILRLVHNMTEIMEATLDFSRNDVTREESRYVDLSALVTGLVDDFQDMGYQVSLSSSIPEHVVISCKSVALTRALSNLIKNAVTYGTQAEVGLENGQEKIVFSVEDNGPGIPAEKMDDVFKPFVRLDEARESGSGTGLGLSIINSVARAHGGYVCLSNRLQGGLKAQIILPKISSVQDEFH